MIPIFRNILALALLLEPIVEEVAVQSLKRDRRIILSSVTIFNIRVLSKLLTDSVFLLRVSNDNYHERTEKLRINQFFLH